LSTLKISGNIYIAAFTLKILINYNSVKKISLIKLAIYVTKTLAF